MNMSITDLDNGLSSNRHQVIIWTNTGLLLIGSLAAYINDIRVKITIFIAENAFENVVCKMAAILH